MSLSPELRARLEQAMRSAPVVLFMKGTRAAPRCGFSASVVQLLDRLLPEYETVDVLADPEVREGIKRLSGWPTIPQLYVAGELVGGADIVREMYATGELHDCLGLRRPDGAVPRLAVTDAAAGLIREAARTAPAPDLHLAIDARGRGRLAFAPREGSEVAAESNGVVLLLDPDSAPRADGLELDAVETPQGPGLRLRDPRLPRVRQLEPRELERLLAAVEPLELYDVRGQDERELAQIAGARWLDAAAVQRLESLDRGTRLVFHCHHGSRSQAAAEHFVQLGFRNVWNLAGGIDAWSREVDPSVPRY